MPAQFTSLFDNGILSRLERLRLNPMRRLTNRSRGEHLAGKGGTSTEFCDYRDYVPGDDVRYIDWNIFSRLNRPYLKLYQHEEEMHVVLLIDSSGSMRFEGKLERALQLAGAFGLCGMMNMERVSAYLCHDAEETPRLLPPTTGRASRKRLFEFLETASTDATEAGGDFPIELAVDTVLRRHRGRGIVVLLSDFLTFGELERPFNRLYSAGLEIFAVQILSPLEINPDVTGDLRFVDSETEFTLDVSSVGDLMGIYHEHRLGLQQQLETNCQQRGGRFLSISSGDSLDWILFDLLRRKGWVR